jgi:hypothetical protein
MGGTLEIDQRVVGHQVEVLPKRHGGLLLDVENPGARQDEYQSQ